MNKPLLSALVLVAVAMPLAAQQYKDTEDTPKDAVIKRDETVKPEGRYANMPDEAVPYRRFTKPYYDRSEEHTSELQSLRLLVCRLLLDRKSVV